MVFCWEFPHSIGTMDAMEMGCLNGQVDGISYPFGPSNFPAIVFLWGGFLAGTRHLVACKTLVSYLLEKKHITIPRLLLEQCL